MLICLHDQRHKAMLLDFSDHPREGYLQSSDKEGVRLYIHGIGIVTVKIEQLREVRESEYGRTQRYNQKSKEIDQSEEAKI